MKKLLSRLVNGVVGLCGAVFLVYSQHKPTSHSHGKNEPAYQQAEKRLHLNSHVCENALVNITRGRWVRKVDLEKYKDQLDTIALQEERLVSDLQEYWLNNGVQSATWSRDLRCGYVKLVLPVLYIYSIAIQRAKFNTKKYQQSA